MDAAPPPARRRILLSSFACSPLWGSEPGVGWQWLLQLARRHEVELLTHAFFRSHLEPALAAAGLQDLQVHYLAAPAAGLHAHRQLNSRLYYSWWQWWVRAYVRKLLVQRRFDLIHHLTWGTLRFPCLLGGLGVPLVMGPLGGGEAAPLRLFAGLPLKVRAFDYLRSLSLVWVRLDPLATWGPRRAALVLCKSSESLHALPAEVQHKSLVVPEIGSPPIEHKPESGPTRACTQGQALRLLFAGRLLGWKGVALALGAVAKLRDRGLDVQFDIAGAGPLRPYLEGQVRALHLQGRVRLLGQVAREELLALYGEADLFLFPSLHDSSGNVVLESLSRGLPVVCLDLGGPQLYVNADCGVVVATSGLGRPELETRLADAVAALVADPGRLAAMSRHAEQHARRQSWEATVGRAYGHIGQCLNWGPL